jgi:hypothetical protein
VQMLTSAYVKVSPTPAVGARGCPRHAGVRETFTRADMSTCSKVCVSLLDRLISTSKHRSVGSDTKFETLVRINIQRVAAMVP